MRPYRLYHATDPRALVHPTPHGPFDPEGEVDAESLSDAYQRSQHGVQLSGDPHRDPPWHTRAGVRRTAHAEPRSTSVGDLIVTPDGQAYLVQPVSFLDVGTVNDGVLHLHGQAGTVTLSRPT
ncbi:hypothetical protein [Deinococcus soli (ex Cha et al. 2016)]|uniref:hypothetical protein n=1 Tax=Deinococcus soli (ex Cha et al. 2016) TaxID=1309411 RepID=UPI00166C991B|nr:hypothetical protein [Deinococcus soli (ex Cha et al. 2016)]GGB79446.1 hypothetical protein GCM10008019_39590 [Deinococcus soli (ex Cha et al. 2016)]